MTFEEVKKALNEREIRLYPYQKRFLQKVFRPAIDVGVFSSGRGSGKSFMGAAACLPYLVGKTKKFVQVVASSLEQGKLVYDEVLNLLDIPPHERPNNPDWKIMWSTQGYFILNKYTGSKLQVMSSDSQRAHGFTPDLVICDELTRWSMSHGEKMWNALLSSASKIAGCKIIAVGTRPAGNHFYNRILEGKEEDGYFVQLYSVPVDHPHPFSLEAVKLANPGLGHGHPDKKATLRRIKVAKNDPSVAPQVKNLILNMAVSEIEESTLLDVEKFKEVEVEDGDREGVSIWGIDLGKAYSPSAIVAVFENGFCDCVAALPKKTSLVEHDKKHALGRTFQTAKMNGELVQLGGKDMDIEQLLMLGEERFGRPSRIVADAFNFDSLADVLTKLRWFTPLEKRYGMRDYNDAIRMTRELVRDKKVTVKRNEFLRFNLAESIVSTSSTGQERILKRAPGKNYAFNDCGVALVWALGRWGKTQRQMRFTSEGKPEATFKGLYAAI